MLCAASERYMIMKVAVLGAGVSGLTISRLLRDRGYEVVVYEKEDRPGGLARSRFTEGYLYDPYGGHIFNSKDHNVVDWVFSILPKEHWQHSVRNARIWFDDWGFISYPFELSLMELPQDVAIDCALDYVLAQQGPEPENFRDWLTWNFGERIADTYMLPYNRKIWAYPLERMETGWMRGKMPLPTKKEMLRSITPAGYQERKMPHSTFYYPLKGGIQTMMDAIAAGLDLKLDCPVESVERSGKGWRVNGGSTFNAVISTIQPQALRGVMELPEQVDAAISGLKYNHLNTVLFNCPATDISWCYIPEKKYRAHRIGFQSTLTPYATPEGKGGCGALEIIGDRVEVDDHLLKSGTIIPEVFEADHVIDSAFAEFAYVIHDLDYRKNTQIMRSYFSQLDGFHILGRWGEWNYNNMDVCMGDAFALFQKEFEA